MNKRNSKDEIKHLTFLFAPYELDYWWFSSVDLLRRLLLTSFLLAFSDPRDQLMNALAVCLLFVNVYREAQPYSHHMHNTAAHIAQWEVLMCVIGVILLETDMVSDSLTEQTYLGWFLILFNLFSILVIIFSHNTNPKNNSHRAAMYARNEKGEIDVTSPSAIESHSWL